MTLANPSNFESSNLSAIKEVINDDKDKLISKSGKDLIREEESNT
jgi:hypothetical protein